MPWIRRPDYCATCKSSLLVELCRSRGHVIIIGWTKRGR